MSFLYGRTDDEIHCDIQVMADRIEELEAKLAKAVEMALEECPFGYGTRKARDWWRNQRATLAELKVGDRG